MFSFEFMTGALFLTTIKLTMVLVWAFLVAIISKRMYDSYNANSERFVTNNKHRFVILGFLFLIAIVLSTNSTLQPKRAIDLPVNREQIEYDAPKDIEIITPEERTQTLDGFRPLSDQ